MKNRISRRDFLKISGGALFSAAMLGYGSRKAVDFLERHDLPSATLGAPNVILIVLDTVRASNLSLYGYERPTTPNLKKIARNGILFTNAFVNGTWTLPSHSSMFTGRYPHKLTADWRTPLDGSFPVIAELFQALGYQTAGFVANRFYCSFEFGLNRGFSHYEDYLLSPGQVLMSSTGFRRFLNNSRLEEILTKNDNLGRKSAEMVREAFIDWTQQRDASRPNFTFLNFFDAHDPYLPPSEYSFKYSAERSYGYVNPVQVPNPEILHRLVDAYDSSITYLDDQIGLLFQDLEGRGWLDNTLVVITSDHGEQFGEHKLMTHGNSTYLPLIHVPLILYYPGVIPAGHVINTAVSLMDMPMTIIDLLGLPNISNFPGKSLRRHWSSKPQAEMIYSEVRVGKGTNHENIGEGWIKSLIYEDIHFIQNPNRTQELYHFKDDTQEVDNLVDSAAQASLLAEFSATISEFSQ